MSFDEIIVTDLAKSFLEENGILPSQWKLPMGESKKIINAGVKIAIMWTPASEIKLPACVSPDEYSHMVIIDASYLSQKIITPDMQVGVILHEIGHVVDHSKSGGNIDYITIMKYGRQFENEVSADQYASLCGYGSQFAEALQTMRDKGVYGFDSDSVAERIRLLKAVSPQIEQL